MQKVYNLFIGLFISLVFFFGSCENKTEPSEKKEGVTLIIKISFFDAVKFFTVSKSDSLFQSVMDSVKSKMKDGSDFFELLKSEWDSVKGEKDMVSCFYSPDMLFESGSSVREDKVMDFLKENSEFVINQTIEVFKKRIQRFGCDDFSISRTDDPELWKIEIKGIADSKRIDFLIESGGNLEFWETFENKEVFPYLEQINDSIVKESQSLLEDDSLSNASLFSFLIPWVRQDNTLEDGPVVGFALEKDTTLVMELLSRKNNFEILPVNIKFLWAAKPYGEKGNYFQLIAIKKRIGNKAPLDGSVITMAYPDVNNNTGAVRIVLGMNSVGAHQWEKLTEENIGRSIAIVFDNRVYSFPVVNSKIADGKSMISGNFSKFEAEDLSNLLKAKNISVKAKIIEKTIH